jgi:hypothetical protein
MLTPQDYAIFCDDAYRIVNPADPKYGPEYQDNFSPLPQGYVRRQDKTLKEFFDYLRTQGCTPPENTGFSAWTYQNTEGKVVIAFRGTEAPDPADIGDIRADVELGMGRVSDQAALAYHYTQWIKQTPGILADQITFTGHSLGGALASIVAAYEFRPAYIFNPAPNSATALSR